MNCNYLFRTRSHCGCLALALGIIAAQRDACGQEALRVATQADLAETAAAQQSEGSSLGYYNLLVGPTAWRFSSGLGVEYNSNIRNSENAESAIIVIPSLNTQMHWPVSINNNLDISLGAGYSEYLQHSELSQFFITSGSGFSFDVFVGDCRINLHDQVFLTQSSYQNPGVSGENKNVQTLQNTIGAGATWNFGRMVPSLGFDHADYLSLVSSTIPDTTSENFTGSLGFPIQDEYTVGAEAGGSFITYGSGGQPSGFYVTGATQWSAGLFGNSQITDYLSVQLRGGYTDYIPDNSVPGNSANSDAGFYFSASINHRVNQWLNYTLSGGRSTDLSSFGQVQTRSYVSVSPAYNLFNHYQISTPFTYQSGTQPGFTPTSGVANYDQLVLGITVSREITKKLSASAEYQYVDEESTLATLTYTVNIISLNITYQF